MLIYLFRRLCRARPNFTGKTALVTGASSGIGEQLCYELSRLGANVILVSRRQTELRRVQAAMPHPDKSFVHVCDMKNPEAVFENTQALVQNFERITGFKKLDILVLNAGVSQREQFEKTLLSVYKEVMDVNFTSCVYMTKAALPHLIANGGGVIAGTSSIYGRHAAARRTAYSAAKHALEGFLNSLRSEVAHHNISTTAVAPGCIYTNVAYNSLLGDGRKMAVTDARIKLGMPASECAREYAEAIFYKERVRVIGTFKEKATVFFSRISARLEAMIALKSYTNLLAKAKAKND